MSYSLQRRRTKNATPSILWAGGLSLFVALACEASFLYANNMAKYLCSMGPQGFFFIDYDDVPSPAISELSHSYSCTFG